MYQSQVTRSQIRGRDDGQGAPLVFGIWYIKLNCADPANVCSERADS
jgi:hypothetical protein